MAKQRKSKDNRKLTRSLDKEIAELGRVLENAQKAKTQFEDELSACHQDTRSILQKLEHSRGVVEHLQESGKAVELARIFEIDVGDFSRFFTNHLKDWPKAPLQGGQGGITTTRWTERFLTHLRNACTELKTAVDPKYCEVVIGAWPSLIHNFIPLVLHGLGIADGSLYEHVPAATIRCLEFTEMDAASLLVDDKVDFALCAPPPPLSDTRFVSEPLFPCQEVGLLLPPKSRALQLPKELEAWLEQSPANRGPLSLQWLAQVPLIFNGDWFIRQMNTIAPGTMQAFGRRIEVFASKSSNHFAEEGLGVTLGNEPDSASLKRGVRFIRLVDQPILGWTDEQNQSLWKFAAEPWVVHLCRLRRPRIAAEDGNQQRLYDRVMEAIRVTAKRNPIPNSLSVTTT